MPSRVGSEAQQAWKTIVGTFKNAYAYMGTVLILSSVSFLWFTAASFLVSLPAKMSVIALVGGLILTAPAFASVCYTVNRILEHEDVGIRDFLNGLSRFWSKGLGLAAVYGIIVLILVADIIFFLSSGNPWVKAIGIPLGYGLLFIALMANYTFPILVMQDPGLVKLFKRSALLVLDNLVFTTILALASLVILGICIVFTPALMLIFTALIAFLEMSALRVLFQKYGLIAPEKSEDDRAGEEGSDISAEAQPGVEGGTIGTIEGETGETGSDPAAGSGK